MPLSVPTKAPSRGSPGARHRRWVDCPRCGEHWPGGARYCANCGWLPEGARPAPDAAASHQEGQRANGLLVPAALLALGLTLGLVLWAWATDVGDGAAAAPAVTMPQAQAQAAADPAPPATAAAVAPSAAASSARAGIAVPEAGQTAVMAADASAATRADAVPADDRLPEQVARDWLATEAGAGQDPSALRPYYAARVAYRGHANAQWAAIAADKAQFMRRWPERRYELLALQPQGPGAERGDDTRRLALRVRWRLQSRSHWRQGESLTLLTLHRLDGHWCIVAEAAAGTRPRPPAPAQPA